MSTPLRPEKNRIKLLYLRLTDSAPLIVAQELGFFTRFGLNVKLQRETSWATLRDKLIGGAADAAAMLAPMPLTIAQTLPQCSEKLLSGLILSCNGNAITLGTSLYSKLSLAAEDCDAAAVGRALRNYIRNRGNEVPIRLATVYPFSSHTLQLRHWLRAARIDPDRDLQILVLPPEQMVDSLHRGDIDGYCVGEPWNTLAAQRGIGVIATPCNNLLPAMPEKVLAVTASWHHANPAAHLALRAALLQACNWLADRSQRRDATALLARQEYLDLPQELLTPSLSDQLYRYQGAEAAANPGWHLFAHSDSDQGRPTTEKARQLLEQCGDFSPVTEGAEQAFRGDLHQQTVEFLQRQK
ncbi:CmpA/NrtA family ABC transporter substrate-binding protein [Microbulbifer marinus]|uniref:NitT/TauT family transport system ATP-binding protein/nitrate/nitrite transport system substrate-binding protein n=1 Tax=Microbulbifer marinus TaxID=658218 RepID=A0A1H3XKD1_9GAMM|nr:CmpA/NrtA family ABC transporter substrate-binding protein [Microbulbifer marinus]SDZ99008.1 NitT/TauT family transport system ATP-binding protein/nitrate/nitrite transport system substrate-binding protein [Microbulbifer marinus]